MYGCASSRGPSDQITYKWPSELASERWDIAASHKDSPSSMATEWLKKGESMADWRELVTSRSYDRGWGGPTPVDAMAMLRQQWELDCTGDFEWQVIEQDPASVVFEVRAKGCRDMAARYELGRVVDGAHRRFHLGYTAKDNAPSDARRALWLKMIKEAKVEHEH
jgi:hypothetical protein